MYPVHACYNICDLQLFTVVQINLDSSTSSVFGGGFRSKYILEQLHFHWSSEHTIDGRRYALEMHLVHRQSRYASVEQASSYKAGIAVLAVLFHVAEHPNEAIQLILNSTSPIKAKIDDRKNDITRNEQLFSADPVG